MSQQILSPSSAVPFVDGTPLPESSDPYRECFVTVAHALQGQKGKRVTAALRALAFARRTAIEEYGEILAIAQVLQDALMKAEGREARHD